MIPVLPFVMFLLGESVCSNARKCQSNVRFFSRAEIEIALEDTLQILFFMEMIPSYGYHNLMKVAQGESLAKCLAKPFHLNRLFDSPGVNSCTVASAVYV